MPLLLNTHTLPCTSLPAGCSSVSFFFKYLFILDALGLSCTSQDLHCDMQTS